MGQPPQAGGLGCCALPWLPPAPASAGTGRRPGRRGWVLEAPVAQPAVPGQPAWLHVPQASGLWPRGQEGSPQPCPRLAQAAGLAAGDGLEGIAGGALGSQPRLRYAGLGLATQARAAGLRSAAAERGAAGRAATAYARRPPPGEAWLAPVRTPAGPRPRPAVRTGPGPATAVEAPACSHASGAGHRGGLLASLLLQWRPHQPRGSRLVPGGAARGAWRHAAAPRSSPACAGPPARSHQ